MPRTLKTSLPLLAFCGLISCAGPEEKGQDVAKIVYAVRQHTSVDGNGDVTSIDVAGGMGQVMDYNRYNPGGKLEILDLRDGSVVNLIAAYREADVSSVDVSFDATKVLFTMKTTPDDNYHIYWASLEPEGNSYEIHQLTFGAYDDINAVWAPGDRIVFVTNQGYTQMGTRADEYNHSRVVTQLATITFGGGDADRKLCSQNLSHLVTLFNMQDGRVGFSRWEHLENVNDVKVFAMNPDCTGMTAISGQHGKPGNSVVQVTESNTRNVFYGIVTERENTIQAGAIVRIDARSALDPSRVDEEKDLDEAYSIVTPDVPRDDGPSAIGRYRSPAVLPDGRLLVSWAPGAVNESNEQSLTPPDYGIYVYNKDTRSNELVQNHEGSWEVYARPIFARDEPPIISGRQITSDASVATQLGSMDIKQTSLYAAHGERVSGAQFDETPMDDALAQATRVRIIEGFSSEAATGVTMFGLTMAEGAAIIGEATVMSDGSWLADVPPYVPVHLQPIDRYDLSIRSQTTWIQGMPNESRVCGGCHESRTQAIGPTNQQLTLAAGRGAEAMNLPIAQRVEYPWAYPTAAGNPNEIQALLNAKCVSCHNETTNGNDPQETYTISMSDMATGMTTDYVIPRMDLSAREITVNYDREERPWPASYVSLFYPAALEMGEVMDFTVTAGTVPPTWAVPSDARNSVLIEKLNVTALSDVMDYAWPLGTAFSDATVKGQSRTDHAMEHGMTREEVVKLIRAIDMGGQFYSRQNTDFMPFTNDPIAGAQY